MELGSVKRVYTIEPLEDPVPTSEPRQQPESSQEESRAPVEQSIPRT